MRRTGGGPRLTRSEWAALIMINRAHAGNAGKLADALERASMRLTLTAAEAGAARPGTRLRSPSGLRRRLTVVRALEAGQSAGLPAEARRAWALFTDHPAEAFRLADEILAPGDVEASSVGTAPSRGPAPTFGQMVSVREDGENRVYLLRLAGPSAKLLYGGSPSLAVIKIGRSANPLRRRDELNWGFPPGCGLEWRLENDLAFPSCAEAHAFEQTLLKRLQREGATIGGEYARVPPKEVAELLHIGLDSIP